MSALQRRPAARLTALLFLVVLAPLSAPAQTWFPLDTGFFWSYVAGSSNEVRSVEGSVQVLGVPTQSILYSPSPVNLGLRNFWTTAPDGDVLLHGFDNPTFAAWAYDPPIVLLDAPLFLGKTWQQTSLVRDPATGDILFDLTIAFEVVHEGVLAVPAGSFDTFGIGQIVPRVFTDGAGAAYGLDGARITAGRGIPNQYYALNVGVVRDIADSDWQLAAYGLPTAVESRSWGGVKGLYR